MPNVRDRSSYLLKLYELSTCGRIYAFTTNCFFVAILKLSARSVKRIQLFQKCLPNEIIHYRRLKPREQCGVKSPKNAAYSFRKFILKWENQIYFNINCLASSSLNDVICSVTSIKSENITKHEYMTYAKQFQLE